MCPNLVCLQTKINIKPFYTARRRLQSTECMKEIARNAPKRNQTEDLGRNFSTLECQSESLWKREQKVSFSFHCQKVVRNNNEANVQHRRYRSKSQSIFAAE